jgi:hypothetical protein
MVVVVYRLSLATKVENPEKDLDGYSYVALCALSTEECVETSTFRAIALENLLPTKTENGCQQQTTTQHIKTGINVCTMSAPDVAGPLGDDIDLDNASIQTADQPSAQQRAAAATPEDEVAQAMAEVAAMEGGANARGGAQQNDRAGEEALMGAAGGEDGVAGFEVTDESGELVKQRFLGFLGN